MALMTVIIISLPLAGMTLKRSLAQVLPATSDARSRELFECALVCPVLAIALVQAHAQCTACKVLPAGTKSRLRLVLQEMAEVIGARRYVDIDALLGASDELGEALDALHQRHFDASREALRRLFILRVALEIAGQLLRRYRVVLAPGTAAEEEGAYAH